MKKTFGFSVVVMLGFASLCLHGCGEQAVKGDESMESTFAKAKQDNPNATPPPPKSNTIKPEDGKKPTAGDEAANNDAK